MTDKAEVALLPALAEGLGALEVDVVQIAVVDDVAVAEHPAEPPQQVPFPEFMLIEALVALEMVTVLRIIVEPGVPPALAGTVLEPQRDDLLHHRKEEGKAGHLLELLRRERSPHMR